MQGKTSHNIEGLKSLCALWPDKQLKIGVSFDTYHDLRREIDMEIFRMSPEELNNPEYKLLEHFTVYICGTRVTIFAQEDIENRGYGLR